MSHREYLAFSIISALLIGVTVYHSALLYLVYRDTRKGKVTE